MPQNIDVILGVIGYLVVAKKFYAICPRSPLNMGSNNNNGKHGGGQPTYYSTSSMFPPPPPAPMARPVTIIRSTGKAQTLLDEGVKFNRKIEHLRMS